MAAPLGFWITQADMVAFSLHLQQTVPRLKRTSLGARVVLTVLGAGLGLWLARPVVDAIQGESVPTDGDPSRAAVLLVCAVVFAILFWFLWPSLERRAAVRTNRRLQRLQQTPAEQPFQLWLDDFGLHCVTETSNSVTAYSAIDRIDETPHYTYIVLSPMRAFVIPNDRVDPAALASFLAELRQHAPQTGVPRDLR